jgi:hypothetical protein
MWLALTCAAHNVRASQARADLQIAASVSSQRTREVNLMAGQLILTGGRWAGGRAGPRRAPAAYFPTYVT